MAGLVGGDSDSSALTQESGEEVAAFTPRESVVTGTDAGTDYEDDTEVQEISPGLWQSFSLGTIVTSFQLPYNQKLAVVVEC